jgi:hypothetical protein
LIAVSLPHDMQLDESAIVGNEANKIINISSLVVDLARRH